MISNQWKMLTAGAALALLNYGCGAAAKMGGELDQASEEAAASEDQQANEEDASESAGGSFMLTAPESAAEGVETIRVIVTGEEGCGMGEGGPGGRPGMPPPPPPGHGFGGEEMANDEGSAEADETALTHRAPKLSKHKHGGGRPPHAGGACVVAEASEAFEASKVLTLDGLPVGTFTVRVVLEDAEGKPIEQGEAEVEIKAGETATAAITLEPVPVGSVAVTVTRAPGTDEDSDAETDSGSDSESASDGDAGTDSGTETGTAAATEPTT